MALTLRKATREKTKMRIGLAGTSGSGKTYSSLVMASGMAPWEKIALIDTENGSGDLYAHLGAYNVVTIGAPFTPERYIEAIEMCEKAGIEVIIIDSMTHEWDGKGGILELKDQMTGNSYTAWAKLTPRHNAFINKLLQSSCHIICTMRSKQDYVLVEKNGKQVPQKVGLKAITREGVEYEFTVVLDIDINHMAVASKDRTEIFMKPGSEIVIPEKITAETGRKLMAWAQEGVEVTPQKATNWEKAPVTVTHVDEWIPPTNVPVVPARPEDVQFSKPTTDTRREPTDAEYEEWKKSLGVMPAAEIADTFAQEPKRTPEQNKLMRALWSEYEVAANVTGAESDKRRKALMHSMFGVETSINLTVKQADELIKKIRELTYEATL